MHFSSARRSLYRQIRHAEVEKAKELWKPVRLIAASGTDRIERGLRSGDLQNDVDTQKAAANARPEMPVPGRPVP
jgi:hypothetical protein